MIKFQDLAWSAGYRAGLKGMKSEPPVEVAERRRYLIGYQDGINERETITWTYWQESD